MTEPTEIAIIGAGFSGAMTAVNLAMQAPHAITLRLYDTHGGFARGTAYGTSDPSHLLNVVACKMGATDDRLAEFHEFAKTRETAWQAQHGGPAFTEQSFLPRMLYGDYVTSLLRAASDREHVTLETAQDEVTDILPCEGGFRLMLAGGMQQRADRVVLALGNLPARDYGYRGVRYTAHLWNPAPGSLLTKTGFTSGDAPVVIIGTGLTTVDAMLTLRKKNYHGQIVALSRHGLFPQPHRLGLAPYPAFLKAADAPATALGIARRIRAELKQAADAGIDWRAVLDSLRQETPALWMKLSHAERRKALKFMPWWNTHRHRMPPESATFIEKELQNGTLRIESGHVKRITDGGDHLNIELEGGRSIRSAHVLNCSGPDTSITRANMPLLASLLRRGMIAQGPLGMGMAVDESFRLRGGGNLPVFALGPLLVGERFETVAVPELRGQAATVAKNLLASL